jgi:hypothetical protein
MNEIKERVQNLAKIKKGNTYEVGNETNDWWNHKSFKNYIFR